MAPLRKIITRATNTFALCLARCLGVPMDAARAVAKTVVKINTAGHLSTIQ